MSTKGRKRTPVETKLVRGTFRPDRVAPNMAQAVPGEPAPPCDTSPAEQAWFEKLKFYLKGENRGSRSDEMVLWQAAKRAAEIQELELDIALHGRTYETALGLRKSNPAVGQMNEAMRHLQSLLAELGLTPASRSRVSADLQAPVRNEWADDGFEAVTVN